MKKILSINLLILLLFMTSCAHNPSHTSDGTKSQVEIRNYQARMYETNSKEKIMNAVISTMLDLGFIIEKADDELGVITGLSSLNNSKVTISIRKSSSNNIIVRLNAQHNNKPIEDPMAYNNFFNSLSQSLFLQAHEVE